MNGSSGSVFQAPATFLPTRPRHCRWMWAPRPSSWEPRGPLLHLTGTGRLTVINQKSIKWGKSTPEKGPGQSPRGPSEATRRVLRGADMGTGHSLAQTGQNEARSGVRIERGCDCTGQTFPPCCELRHVALSATRGRAQGFACCLSPIRGAICWAWGWPAGSHAGLPAR